MKNVTVFVLSIFMVTLFFTGVPIMAASANENLVVNGDFENADTLGWTWDNGNRGTGSWIRMVETDINGNHYLKLSKNWWGYNRYYQDIFITTTDLDIDFSFRPVQLGRAGIFSVQEGVAVAVEMYDAADVRLGYVQHYYETYNQYPTTGAQINIKLGNRPTADWEQVSYNLKETILDHAPDFDFSNIVKVRVWLKNWQAGHAREWSTGYFDDISVKKKIIPARVQLHPETLNTKSKGQWVTAYIQLPVAYDVNDIAVSTIKLEFLNRWVPAETAPFEIGDYDEDGIADLMVKFSRRDVSILLADENAYIGFQICGQLSSGGQFQGEDAIKVISKQ